MINNLGLYGEELKKNVYSALVRYLEEKEYLRTQPFDETHHKTAT